MIAINKAWSFRMVSVERQMSIAFGQNKKIRLGGALLKMYEFERKDWYIRENKIMTR